MAKLFSSNQQSGVASKHLVKKKVKSTQLEKKQTQAALQKASRTTSSQGDLDSINLFNPPKINPNGRLAASRLFDRVPKDTATHKRGTLARSISRSVDKDSTVKLSNSTAEYLNFWRIGAISIILLVNILSAFVILKDKFFKPTETQELATTPEILAGKTNLAAEEFIIPSLNSLSSISTGVKGDNKMESDVQTQVSLPLAIPPTNLPNKGIISSGVANISYYYILVPYTGEESLQLAQEQVKSVSLVNFPQGIFIYLGAFSQRTDAEKFINKIKAQGLDGYIYHAE